LRELKGERMKERNTNINIFSSGGIKFFAELHHIDTERTESLTDLRTRLGLVGRDN
jgi:hypothetical protein